MELSTRARRRLSTILALVLAAESVSVVSVAAASVGGVEQAGPTSHAAAVGAAPVVLVRTAVAAQAGAASAPWFTPRVVERAEPPAAAPVAATPAHAPQGDPALRAALQQA